MGFRFRKSKKLGPFRFTMSNSGISSSVGGKGFRYTKRADGKTQISVGIPGSGLYYTETIKQNSSNAASGTNGNSASSNSRQVAQGGLNSSRHGWLIIAVLLAVLLSVLQYLGGLVR
jgi:hypothetical protein